MAGFRKDGKHLVLGQMTVASCDSGMSGRVDSVIIKIGDTELIMGDDAASQLSYWLRSKFDYGKPRSYDTLIEVEAK